MIESKSARAVFFAVGGFVAGAALMGTSSNFLAPEKKQIVAIVPARNQITASTSANAIVPASAEAAVQVNTQAPTSSVMVSSVALAVSGWLVVHELTDGHVGNALGAARRDAGTYADVSIELLRPTEAKTPYMLVLYRDNGNKEFDIRGDIPIVDQKGDPVMQRFKTL